jgi:hypothetical protein
MKDCLDFGTRVAVIPYAAFQAGGYTALCTATVIRALGITELG